MRKSLWIVPILFVAIGAPSAHADNVVDISVSLTFSGPLPNCGTLGNSICTETLSSELVYDETTGVVTSSTTSNSSTIPALPLFTFAFVQVEPPNSPTLFQWQDTPFRDSISLTFFTPTPSPGVYTAPQVFASIQCLTPSCLNGFPTPQNFVSPVSVTVVPTPEPGTNVLMLAGVGFLLVMLKRVA